RMLGVWAEPSSVDRVSVDGDRAVLDPSFELAVDETELTTGIVCDEAVGQVVGGPTARYCDGIVRHDPVEHRVDGVEVLLAKMENTTTGLLAAIPHHQLEKDDRSCGLALGAVSLEHDGGDDLFTCR